MDATAREQRALAEIQQVLARHGCTLSVGVVPGQTAQMPDGSLMMGQRCVVQIVAVEGWRPEGEGDDAPLG